MYPGFIAEYDDQSDILSLPVSEVRNKHLFGAIFTSDKGTEKWMRITGEDFFNMYGKSISFAKHGQPLLQSAMAINAGAELLCKRLVADDATLANIGIIATISNQEVQKTDADGNALYTDADGNETTVADGNTPVMSTVGTVKYSLASASGVKTVAEAEQAIKAELGESDYLLYTIGDIGRGVSKKRIKIIPNYRLSKSADYTYYTLYVLENSEEVESISFSTNHNIIVNGENISLQSMIRTHSTQLTCAENYAGMEEYVAKLAEIMGIDEKEMFKYDVLFGKYNNGKELGDIVIDNTGIDLQYTYGNMLEGGDNGAFGSHPWEKEDVWTTQAIAALDGSFDHVIYNLDQYKIAAWVDANYPDKVKRAVEALATFREDFMYFRDQGLGQNNIPLIQEVCMAEAHNMFCATYPQSYDVIDPYTKRQITVTIGYSLAQLLVNHCDNGTILPTAGIKHNMIIHDAIYGTLSFAPAICPDPVGNQKEQLEDLRVNYASYIDNQLVIEALYTSQERYTQWSFVNNVMGIQEVVKALRTRCPAIRYSFIEGEDLEQYKADVEEVLARYRSNFNTLELEYVADATYAANKIFYAVLKVVYKNFVQTEWFKVTALNSVEVINS